MNMSSRLCLFACLAATALAGPLAGSMLHPEPLLTTYTDPNSGRYSTAGSPQFDGVALLTIETSEGVIGCTGALLPSGIHILTAAHCLSRTGYASGAWA